MATLKEGQLYAATPTAALFHNDDSFARFVMGPFGSGKSVMGIMELLLRGMQQVPDAQGRRRTKAIVVRNTYPELRSTTIPTYMSWMEGLTEIKYTSPITGTLEMGLPDGTTVQQIIYFLALDNDQDIKHLQGLEPTFAFIDEFVHVTKGVIDTISGRVGRYPEMRDGGPTWAGYFGSSNPCGVDHWYYKLAEEAKPKHHSFYRQPPGLLVDEHGEYITNPDAENIENLPKDYYTRQAAGKDPSYIKVFLLGEYGELKSGKPVYPSYDDVIHCSKTPFGPQPGTDITIGIDVGLHGNAAVFTQLLPNGEFIVFDELLFEEKSITEFVRDYLKPYISNNYFKYNYRIVCDPAARNRSQSDKKSGLDIFIEHGLPAELAPTNDFMARREAVVFFLTKKDGFALSSSCSMLRRGFISQYRYEDIQGRKGKIKEKPDKNIYSHGHDALQYAALFYKKVNVKKRYTPIVAQHTSPACALSGY